MVHAQGWLVAHNTALLLDPAPGLTWGMEARFSDSQGTFAYNLTNMNIWPDRDGAQGTLTDNVTDAQASWFVNPAAGDLHLVVTATNAIDRAATLAAVTDDYDGHTRPIGVAPDVGADEYGLPPPAAVADLKVVRTITATDLLTPTLRWTAPANAITYTLRYSDTFVGEASWSHAVVVSVPFTASTAGTTEWLTTTIPYPGGTLYFALKSQIVGGDWLALSNNAFWPSRDNFLPCVIKDR
jgi:hypothetical protein